MKAMLIVISTALVFAIGLSYLPSLVPTPTAQTIVPLVPFHSSPVAGLTDSTSLTPMQPGGGGYCCGGLGGGGLRGPMDV